MVEVSSMYENDHTHSHTLVDPSILATRRGIWVVKWSFVGLILTALIQIVVFEFSKSVGLLADTIHNFSDALTALPLWVAFRMAQFKPSKRFTYGYGRVEDVAGVAIIVLILFSALVAGYESLQRFFHPHTIEHLGAVVIASLVGFIGNEIIATLRIKVGKEIGSAALIADGMHARIDGFTSLAVFFGAAGVWFGYPLADPLIGLLITIAILKIVWESVKTIFIRILDGIEPELVDDIRHAVAHVQGVQEVTEIRVRWLGHRLHAEINITVHPELSVGEGHAIASKALHELLHHMNHLSNAIIHVDPANASGEHHHLTSE